MRNSKLLAGLCLGTLFCGTLLLGSNVYAQKANSEPAKSKPVIARHPAELDWKVVRPSVLQALPKYDPASAGRPNQVDLRSYDLSQLNVTNNYQDLLHADFDSKTKWPKVLPPNYTPATIMELGKNPGLNVQSLHKQGITGKGVGIAIIDQALLVGHIEYKDQLRLYEEIDIPKNYMAMPHGSAVASIAVGKTVGVAPGADLYYIAAPPDATQCAQAISRILEINKTLPENNKIRVISMSIGWGPQAKGYADFFSAVEQAKKENIFVISSSLPLTHNFRLSGLGRDAFSNPDDIKSFGPGAFLAKAFFNGQSSNALWLPMDARCTASPTGTKDYVFYADNGMSWVNPYAAGLYALACQAQPAITPEKFWDLAAKTGDTIEITNNDKKYKLGKIANPVALINALKQ